MEKKYRVLSEVKLTGKSGAFIWDEGSEITDLQLIEENIPELIMDGKLEEIIED